MSVIGESLVAFIFGSIIGLLVQRSRFCNTAALRDAILFKNFRNTEAFFFGDDGTNNWFHLIYNLWSRKYHEI